GSRSHHVAAGWLASAAPDGLAAHGDGLGLFAGFGHELREDLHRNLLLGEALDVHHETFFVKAHEVDRCAVVTRATGTADAVHIVFADVGDFVVHHVRQLVDV